MVLADMVRDQSLDPGEALTDLLARRRSIRRLSDGPLPDGALDRLLTAARLVPAAYNRHAWHVVVVRERRAAFWTEVEVAFRDGLEGERLERYLGRLDGFRGGVGAILIYEDRPAVEEMRAATGIDVDQARAFTEQALGMVQLAIWLAAVAEGLATSLQHWEALIEDRAAAFLDLPRDRFRLTAVMPLGYPAEEPRPVTGSAVHRVISLETFVKEGSALEQA